MSQFECSTLTTPDFYNEQLDRLLAPLSRKVTYPAKYIFSMPGEDLQGVYYIKSGCTKHYMDNDEGGIKILYTLSPGWFFGETPFFLGVPTGLYSQTEVDTTLYLISGETAEKLMGENKLFRDSMLRCYSQKMLILRYEIANLTFNSCKGRLKRLFCASVDLEHITDPDWYNLRIHYTHGELGEIVGGARVTISRQLSELCNEGFLRIINRRAQVNREQYHAYLKQNSIPGNN